jgi:hypothetical protein
MRKRIFVFGSNLKGIHGSGSAKAAKDHYGAKLGVGEGLTGDSYALPTCTGPGAPDNLENIGGAMERFIEFALAHPEMDFLLTSVGCGVAGYDPQDIINSTDLTDDMPDNVYIQAKLAKGFGG